MSKLTIRLKKPTDDNFIHASWCTNMHSALPNSYISWNVFCEHQNKLINDLDVIATTLVACVEDEPDTILGFLTYSHIGPQLICHFGFVKRLLQRNKIMSQLLDIADPDWKAKLIVLSHISKSYTSLNRKFSLTYNPYIIDTLKEIKGIL